jgi:hypothetical protein
MLFFSLHFPHSARTDLHLHSRNKRNMIEILSMEMSGIDAQEKERERE